MSALHEETASCLAKALRDAADMLESHPGLVQASADRMAREFMAERLPPVPSDAKDKGPEPDSGSTVCCRVEVCHVATLVAKLVV
jgi:hypothetical protein